MEIKAYAGPMTLEKAQTFRKRWKTPPRLIPAAPPGGMNSSESPQASAFLSPQNSPRSSKTLVEVISSTPKHKKKLFEGSGDDSDILGNSNADGNDKNGNLKAVDYQEQEEKEYKEIFNDLLESREIEKANMFNGYRDPRPILETPIRSKHDSNSNHLNHNFNGNSKTLTNDSLMCNIRQSSSSSHMTYLDESGSIYDSSNVFNSPSFKEKHIRLTDINKGLEKIGRELAFENNVGWKEYWDFLERYVEIRSDEGLTCFESYLKRKENVKKANQPVAFQEMSLKTNKLNESFGLGAICAGFYSLDLNDEINEKSNRTTRNGLTSPSNSISRMNLFNDFSHSTQVNSILAIPYMCIEQNFRAFAKRLANLLESDSVQDQNSYEKMLLQEINRLNTSIDNYKHDSRFNVVNFQKVHSRYSFLLVWYLKKNNVDVKYLRNTKPLISKVYSLATQFATPNSFAPHKEVAKIHGVCVSQFISEYIEKQDKIFNPENVETETACVDAWNGPDIVECSCHFGANSSTFRRRREIRKKLLSDNSRNSFQDLWTTRKVENYNEDEDEYLSCDSDLDSDSDEYLTPLDVTPIDSEDEELIVFQESLENLEEEQEFSLFIAG